jgi:hypothetical protein
MMDALLDAHLASSESEAIGGPLTMDYALDGLLSMTGSEQRTVLKQENFASVSQSFAA